MFGIKKVNLKIFTVSSFFLNNSLRIQRILRNAIQKDLKMFSKVDFDIESNSFHAFFTESQKSSTDLIKSKEKKRIYFQELLI